MARETPKRVQVEVDEETHRRVRIAAAEEDTSITKLLYSWILEKLDERAQAEAGE